MSENKSPTKAFLLYYVWSVGAKRIVVKHSAKRMLVKNLLILWSCKFTITPCPPILVLMGNDESTGGCEKTGQSSPPLAAVEFSSVVSH